MKKIHLLDPETYSLEVEETVVAEGVIVTILVPAAMVIVSV